MMPSQDSNSLPRESQVQCPDFDHVIPLSDTDKVYYNLHTFYDHLIYIYV